MVSRAPVPLTKIGFRRDVRLFLTALGGFFAMIIVALVFILESAIDQTRDARLKQWSAIADRAADEITYAQEHGIPVTAKLTALRARYPISELEVTSSTAPPPPGRPATFQRLTPAGMLRLTFDDSDLRALHRKLLVTTAISLGATAFGFVLLLLYIPKITRPIEEMLDHAGEIEVRDPEVDEQQFLIETFKKSIATLKVQQEELRRLHDAQKIRADEFERVTAALTRSLTSGLIAVDARGLVVDVNQAGRDILRLGTGSEVAGRAIPDAIGDSALAAALGDAFEQRTALTRQEIASATPNGEIVIGLTTVPLVTEENAFLGMLALFTDLTEIRRLENRIRDLQALADLGEMSAGIAHEFRNSLSTILGYLRLAQHQSSVDEILVRIQRADQEATVLESAIESLLNFARPMTIDAQPVDLGELAANVVARLEPYASDVEIAVSGAAIIDADRALLARAIENLVRNAIDAVHDSGRTGRIAIDTRNDPPSISVRDNGVGLDAESAGRVFLPFQSRKPHGLGLGLPLARKIVLLHGGSLHIAGTPGEGATVTIEFPARSADT